MAYISVKKSALFKEEEIYFSSLGNKSLDLPDFNYRPSAFPFLHREAYVVKL